MQKTYIILFFYLIIFPVNAQFNYERSWGTYYGDEMVQYRSSCIDAIGNLYIVGSISKLDENLFPLSTPNSHQPIYGGGEKDGFIVKFNPEGNLVWSTYFGGNDSDYIGDILIIRNDIYIIGETQSTNGIATSNAYQLELNNTRNHFISKFNIDGEIIWSTYFGSSSPQNSIIINDRSKTVGLTADEDENIYFYSNIQTDNLSTNGVFQENRADSRFLLSKFTGEGQRIWSTYYGVNASQISSIASTSTGIIVAGQSVDCPPFFQPNTYFATINAHQINPGSCSDAFISKFSFDGQRIWSTYYGGTSNEWTWSYSGEILAINNSIYLGSITSSNNNITTPNSFQPEKDPGTSHFLVKFNDEGERVWGTYVGKQPNASGFTGFEMTSFLTSDNESNILLSGSTVSSVNIATLGSYQENITSSSDNFVIKFTPEGNRLWGTYYGGLSPDFFGQTQWFDNSFYLIGSSKSQTMISTPNAYQPNYISNNLGYSMDYSNISMAKFDPIPLSTNVNNQNPFVIYPNPTDGKFEIQLTKSTSSNFDIEIHNNLGQLILSQKNTSQRAFYLKDVAHGLYFVKIKSEEGIAVEKMIVK
ncbi:T9SS type A sorting domain-containing protein [Flavobacterium sp.]|uniref:T9SS type A sorting domain-containing protein n=1 Tax=Flavobacterium sp. TaxID=239 RepID=UPI002624758C|nr:T9SS type A sorting domain-containing protein [Flavobacterium sp.]MDD2985397.1 T9SS type A sorting domain-containing protein [Flavobacterium sp.]